MSQTKIIKKLNITKYIQRYFSIFDRRTYRSFKKIIEGMIKIREWNQTDLAQFTAKSISAIQYFFGKAKWNPKILNKLRLKIFHNRGETRDRKEDICIFDGSAAEKCKDCATSIFQAVYSGKRKTSVKGLYIYGASILTPEGISYILDFMIFLKWKWKSEWKGWIYLADRVAKITKASLWVFDRGFRNQYFLVHVLKLKRRFLIRTVLDLNVLKLKTQREQKGIGRKKQYGDRTLISVKKLISDRLSIKCRTGRLWVINNVIINAWKKEIKTAGSVIVFHKNGFRNPLVLVYSEAEITAEEALKLVGTYISRWTIENLFKETKYWFGLESFKITDLVGIYKYIHLIILAHSILDAKKRNIDTDDFWRQCFLFVLKKTRNIKSLCLGGLKRLYESVQMNLVDLNYHFNLYLEQNHDFNL